MKLIDYIAGRRRGREARSIEREAMEDVFLRDALDGFDAVESDHIARIDRMRRRVAGRPGRSSLRAYRAVAAAVLLCAALGGYWAVRRHAGAFTEDKLAMNEPVSAPWPGRSEDDSLQLSMGVERHSVEDGLRKKAESRGAGDERSSPVSAAERKSSAAGADRAGALAVAEERETECDGTAADAVVEEGNAESVPSEAAVADAAEREEVRQESVERYYASPAVAMQAAVAAGEESVRESERAERDGTARRNGKRSAEDVRERMSGSVGSAGYVKMKAAAEEKTRDMPLSERKENRKTMASSEADTSARCGPPAENAAADAPAAELLPVGGKVSGRPRPRKGEAHFVRYVEANRRYPSGGEEARGCVVLRFEVGSDGRPRHIEVIRGLKPEADAEAVRLLREGPSWTVGRAPVELVIRFR